MRHKVYIIVDYRVVEILPNSDQWDALELRKIHEVYMPDGSSNHTFDWVHTGYGGWEKLLREKVAGYDTLKKGCI